MDSAIEQLMFFLREGFRGRGEHRHMVGAGGQRRLEALQVGRQHRVADTGAALERAHQLGMVAHLRHPLRRHEGGGLDLAQPGVGQAVDQFQLGGQRHHLLLVLQAVARPHLDDADGGCVIVTSSKSTRSTPSTTWSPTP